MRPCCPDQETSNRSGRRGRMNQGAKSHDPGKCPDRPRRRRPHPQTARPRDRPHRVPGSLRHPPCRRAPIPTISPISMMSNRENCSPPPPPSSCSMPRWCPQSREKGCLPGHRSRTPGVPQGARTRRHRGLDAASRRGTRSRCPPPRLQRRRGGQGQAGQPPIGPWSRQLIHNWLRDMEENFAPVAHWVP
jgi:hypothetical protein